MQPRGFLYITLTVREDFYMVAHQILASFNGQRIDRPGLTDETQAVNDDW